MRLLGIVAAAILLLTPASAQEPPAPQKFTLEVDQNELNAIAQGINELPKRIADPLIQRLTVQLQAQIKANAERAAAAKDNTGIVTQGQHGDNTVNK